MVSKSKKVLVITEGPRDELHLLKSICLDLGISDVDFYSYKTDFHNFARIMLPNGALKPDDTIMYLDYNPKKFFAEISRHRNRFRI